MSNVTYTLALAGEMRAALGRANRSQRDLAGELGVSNTWVARRLSGEVNTSVPDLARFAAALGVPIEALLPKDPAS